MYNVVKRLHLIECDCCGDLQVVDDATLVDMFLNGDCSTFSNLEDEECCGDCDSCEVQH